MIGASHGCIFSLRSPGKNPRSLPTGCMDLVITILWYFPSITCAMAQTSARKVFPLPAIPLTLTNGTSKSISILIANCCSLFFARTPPMLGNSALVFSKRSPATSAKTLPPSGDFPITPWLGTSSKVLSRIKTEPRR